MVEPRDPDGNPSPARSAVRRDGTSAEHGTRPDEALPGTPATPLLGDRMRLLPALLEVIETIETDVPAPYRIEVFRTLVGRDARLHVDTAGRGTALQPASTAAQVRQIPARQRVDLSHYAGILAAPGRTLLKALVALDATTIQLGVDWMSPSEIERFLIDRARVPHVYRTNISNALRGARPLADRRRRGRGYEYRITLTGREALEREQKVLGD